MTEPHVPPQNLDAEESVLGAMLMNKNAIAAVSEAVRREDFYRDSHGIMFQAALDLDARGEPVDAITLSDELERLGQLKAIGGKVRVQELAATVPATANAPHYARIVRETAQRRALISAGGAIAELGWQGNGDLDELMASAEQHFNAATTSTYSTDFTKLGDGDDDLIAQLEQAVESGKAIHGLITGFPDWDRLTTGLYGGQMIVLAARPGVGKSVFAQNVCEYVAAKGKVAAMFTLEMSKRELRLRSIVRKTKLDLHKLRTGRLTREELERVKTAAVDLAQLPMYVEDNPSITATELRARARRMKAKHGLDLLVVDYLQLMLTSNTSRDSRERQVADLSRALKMLAKELNVPVIVVSQLNRNLEYREDKRPTLADLRDSGAIEQDADMVAFLYREETYKKVEPEKGGDAELIVAKNRMGELDTIKLLFLGRRQTFTTPARHNQQEGS